MWEGVTRWLADSKHGAVCPLRMFMQPIRVAVPAQRAMLVDVTVSCGPILPASLVHTCVLDLSAFYLRWVDRRLSAPSFRGFSHSLLTSAYVSWLRANLLHKICLLGLCKMSLQYIGDDSCIQEERLIKKPSCAR